MLLRSCSRAVQQGLCYWTLLVATFPTIPVTIDLALAVPNDSIQRTSLTRMNAVCRTQALVYSRFQLLNVVHYLLEKIRG